MSSVASLAPTLITEALFATISYRLEPGGRGTRFPIVMDSLYAGRLDAKDAGAALIELDHIEAGLRELPPGRVVWSLTDLRRIEDSLLPVNHSAANAYEYFVGGDGRPLLAQIREDIERNMSVGRGMTFHSEQRRVAARSAWALILIGAIWTVVGRVFFPHYILVPGHVPEGGGPLIWPHGLLMIGGGVILLLMALRPGFDRWLRRHGLMAVIALIPLLTAFLYFSWQSPDPRLAQARCGVPPTDRPSLSLPGCKGFEPECRCDAKGNCEWAWVCVPR